MPRASMSPVALSRALRISMPMAVATLRRVTPEQPSRACSSMSPEQASEPSPPVVSWNPARWGPDQVSMVAVMPSSRKSPSCVQVGPGGVGVVLVLLLDRCLHLAQGGGVHALPVNRHGRLSARTGR